MSVLQKLKPGIPKRALFFVASVVWASAAGVLGYKGGMALAHDSPVFTIIALAAGGVFYRLLFARIPERHIHRFHSMPHPTPCLFSFLDWRGYGLMVVMIAIGVLLRTSGILAAPIVGAIYVAMGVPLFLSSLRFTRAGIHYGNADSF